MKYGKKIIVLVMLMYVVIAKGQSDRIEFEPVNTLSGLSNNRVTAIRQDKYGFLWIGTHEGLNKYDGYDFTIYRHNPKDSSSISSDKITCIFEDMDGTLWVGTMNGGLNRLNRATNGFIQFRYKKNDPQSVPSDNITAICEDNTGNLWVGTLSKGIAILKKENKADGSFVSHQNKPGDEKSLPNDAINCIRKDRYGTIWIGTMRGLAKVMDNNQNAIIYRNYTRYSGTKHSLTNNIINDIRFDAENKLWLATHGGGINVFDPKKETFSVFNPKNQIRDKNAKITSLLFDLDRQLWIGTQNSGLYKYHLGYKNIQHYKADITNPKRISGNHITALYRDNGGVLWIGTAAGGLSQFSKDKNKFPLCQASNQTDNTLPGLNILSIFVDSRGFLWVGTSTGLSRIEIKSPWNWIYRNFYHNEKNENSICCNAVEDIIEDKNGDLWFATQNGISQLKAQNVHKGIFENFELTENDTPLSSKRMTVLCLDSYRQLWIGTKGNGILKGIRKNNTITDFIRYAHNPNDSTSIPNNIICDIVEDHNKNIWIATEGSGLAVLLNENRDSMKFIRFAHHPEQQNSLSNNYIRTLAVHSDGTLWAGTDNGLNKITFNNKTKKALFQVFSYKDGIRSGKIRGILEDKKGYLWVSTTAGLSRFDGKHEIFRNYDTRDGLQDNEFNQNSCYKTSQGQLFFGGHKGFNYFFPDSIQNNRYAPQIVLTKFLIFNRPVKAGEDSPIKKHINIADKIVLTYEQNSFSFEFAALHFSIPERNRYAYRMFGFDKQWIYTGAERRFTTYTNLNPGKYLFKVTGANCDAVWNHNGRTIRIVIKPPFWKTVWFYVLVGVILITLLFLFIKLRERKLIAMKDRLENTVKERTVELNKQKEELLLQAESLEFTNRELEKLSIVASKTDNAVVIMDAAGNFEWINEGFSRMYHNKYNDLFQKQNLNLNQITQNPKIKTIIDKCIREKTTVTYESKIENNNHSFWTQTTLTPVLDDDDNVLNLVAIDTDISSLKQAEAEIQQQKNEIEAQRDEIILQHNLTRTQRDQIAAQNKDITDSLKYASRIQSAILPPSFLFKRYFKEYFIYYNPKDFVSGDFYWFNHIKTERNGKTTYKTIIATADCTGHGVPGAFMSILGISFLNEIIGKEQFSDAADILNQLRNMVKPSLHQTGKENEAKDGMDIALCIIDNENLELQYAGAYNPLYIVRNITKTQKKFNVDDQNRRIYSHKAKNEYQLLQIKADKMPISIYYDVSDSFTNHTIQILKDDIIYLFTDGFIDQFGGERNRKFMSKRFKKLVLSMQNKPLNRQKQIIQNTYTNWKKENEQIDDVLILSLKIGHE